MGADIKAAAAAFAGTPDDEFAAELWRAAEAHGATELAAAMRDWLDAAEGLAEYDDAGLEAVAARAIEAAEAAAG